MLAALLLGGSSKDYVPGLAVLRPLAVLALAIGLYGFQRADWHRFRLPLAFMAATLGLIALHLVPLPPSFWMALPGRDLAVLAGEAAGIEPPWRPLSLVPYRGWNAFYATLVPAAVMVCAAQLDRDQHKALAFLVLGAAVISALWASVQAISGYAPSTFLYGAPRVNVPNGLFANRNHLAALLVACLPLLALIASQSKGARASLTVAACAGVAAFLMLIALTTGSRAGIVLSAVSIFASALIWRARPKRASAKTRGAKKPAWASYAVGVFGIAGLGVVALILSQTTGFERLVNAGAGEVEEFRFTVWRTIAGFAPTYLPFGSGIGSFVEVFKVHEPDEMLGQSYWNHAHNDWLEWAVEGGVPAIALMVVTILGWGTRALALARNSQRGRIETQLGLAGAIILFILGVWSLVDYPLRTPALASLAALCAIWMALPSGMQGHGRRGDTGGFASTAPALDPALR